MTTPLERQQEAAQRLGYGAIFLRRLGDKVLVQIMHDGEWRTVIRESIDSNFSHIVEPLGIEEVVRGHDPDRIERS